MGQEPPSFPCNVDRQKRLKTSPSLVLRTPLAKIIQKHHMFVIITVRVRTYDGRLCFHRCVSVQLSGGVPHSRSGRGGIPIPGLAGGGGTPSQVWPGGYPSKVWLGGGTPSQVWSGGVPPDQVWMGYPPGPGTGSPPPRPGTGYPPPDQVWIRQSSTASTCYAAGGVPLAFTQEDFLVYRVK